MALRARAKLSSGQLVPIKTASTGDEQLWRSLKPLEPTAASCFSLSPDASTSSAEFDAFAAAPMAICPAVPVELRTRTRTSPRPSGSHRPSELLLRRTSGGPGPALAIETSLELEPDWAAEFSPEWQTSAFLASQQRERRSTEGALGELTDAWSVPKRRRWSDEPGEEEAVALQAIGLCEQELPPRAAGGQQRPRRAHPLTLEPVAAWNFDKIFRRALPQLVDDETDHESNGLPRSIGGARGTREDEERRRRRAAERLDSISNHLQQREAGV